MPCSSFCVKMVNPRFQNYSRPLLLAIPVGVLTLIAVAGMGTVNFISSLSCNNNMVQIVGTTTDHATFVEQMLTMSEGELTRTVCVSRLGSLVATGTGQVTNKPCAMTQFINERLAEKVVHVPDGDGGSLTEFQGECGGIEHAEDQCEPDLTYVISYDEKVCTRISHPLIAIGAAAGFQEQISFALTMIFIFAFSKLGLITANSGKMFGAVADEQTQIDELKKEIELMKHGANITTSR